MSPNARNRIRRFTGLQRLFHLALMLCFTLQAATGLARMFIEAPWGKSLAGWFGGYAGALSVHKIVGVILLILFGLHILYILFKLPWKGFPFSLFGPDSILPHPRDIGHFLRHLFWMFGLAKPPRFERWAYWEKFDYWAVFWGMAIIGGTGLILYNPVTTSGLMPGWSINLALWVHRIEAMLAIGHLFIIHFFIAHLRRENFPMDTAMFEGHVDLDSTRHERPAWVERLEESGRLSTVLTNRAPVALRAVYYGFGLAMVAVCLYLLIGGLASVRLVTW